MTTQTIGLLLMTPLFGIGMIMMVGFFLGSLGVSSKIEGRAALFLYLVCVLASVGLVLLNT